MTTRALRTFKALLPLFALGLFCAFIIIGCAAPFVEKATTTSVPVQLGAATTNDTQVNAWLSVARVLNDKVNPTPTREPVDLVLVSLMTLATAASGWIARHKTPVRPAPTG
jgi:hypothetical protein